ncbi:glycosyltransferase [Cetobacterium somerae]|uniref:glycosyltransferase n=1 Tax=Cetobacterium somerae TaxID=188913 RepID=UPI00211E2884|nr:glycosyltransferase [Cetobacterium somerae]MCQ9626139.1 glycosyltransferase [Cetobacterium somerae]
MKKILFKSGSTMLGGLEKVQVEYINYLVENGYNLKIVIENDNGPENVLEKDLKGSVTYLKDYNYIKKMKKFRENRKKNLLSKIRYSLELVKEKLYSEKIFLKIYKEFLPDIVIDFDSSLTRTVKKLKTSKNILWIHSSVEHWKKKKSKIQKYVKKIESYDKIICICKEMMQDLIILNKKLEEKVDYIYNPVNENRIKELSKIELKEDEKSLAEKKYLLMVSRLDIVPKDFETLIKAFDLAKEKDYDGELYLIGDGPDKNKVEEMILKSKFSNNIRLLGAKSNPYNWMVKADKLILSSKYEGFGIVILEGLILEKTFISSNCKTGPKEILTNERGYLFKVGDFNSLSTLILNAKDKKITSENLKEFLREEIFNKFQSILKE